MSDEFGEYFSYIVVLFFWLLVCCYSTTWCCIFFSSWMCVEPKSIQRNKSTHKYMSSMIFSELGANNNNKKPCRYQLQQQRIHLQNSLAPMKRLAASQSIKSEWMAVTHGTKQSQPNQHTLNTQKKQEKKINSSWFSLKPNQHNVAHTLIVCYRIRKFYQKIRVRRKGIESIYKIQANLVEYEQKDAGTNKRNTHTHNHKKWTQWNQKKNNNIKNRILSQS